MKVKLIILYIFVCTLHKAQNIDYRLLKNINGKHNANWDGFNRGLSFSIYPVMPACVIGTWSHGFATKNTDLKRSAFKQGITMCLAVGITTSLKYAVKRERPFVQYPNDIEKRDHVGALSFPSGHTTAAFATATALSLSYKKWYVTAPAYAYAGFVGYSRMRLGVHFPSDVLVGALIGTGCGLLTWQLDKVIFKK